MSCARRRRSPRARRGAWRRGSTAATQQHPPRPTTATVRPDGEEVDRRGRARSRLHSTPNVTAADEVTRRRPATTRARPLVRTRPRGWWRWPWPSARRRSPRRRRRAAPARQTTTPSPVPAATDQQERPEQEHLAADEHLGPADPVGQPAGRDGEGQEDDRCPEVEQREVRGARGGCRRSRARNSRRVAGGEQGARPWPPGRCAGRSGPAAGRRPGGPCGVAPRDRRPQPPRPSA